MPQDHNVAFTLRTIAERAPDAPAVLFPETAFGFAQFWQLTEAFALRMRREGVGQGSGVALDSGQPEIVLALMLATAALGARFVQNAGDMDLSDVVEIAHRFHTPDQTAPAPGSVAIDGGWSPAEMRGAPEAETPLQGYADADAPWIYAHSSGTTGYPKFMAFSQRMIADRSRAVADRFVAGRTCLASLFPATSRPFVSRTLGALLNGCPIAVGRDVAFWQRVGVTMVSASPAQARGFFADRTISPRLPVIEVPGSRVDDEAARVLLRSFEAIDNAYGAGETNKTFSNIRTLAEDGTIQVQGRRRDSEIEIVDEDGAACPPGQIGQVRVRNGYTVAGYLTHKQAEAQAFRDGWFYPGDVARWGPGGALEIVSRDDDVVNIGGFKAHALAIDRILRGVDGIADGVCFKNPKPGARDELFAFVVLDGSASQLQAIATAKHRIDEALGPEMVPRIFREIGGIPRRPDGSADRQACAALVLEISRKTR